MTTAKTNLQTVLVVEDEPDVLDLVRYNLTKAGYRVLQARDGLAGLKAAQTKAPDVIILDLMLPGMPGEEVCRTLKAQASTADIPVIMLTAKAQAEERVAGLELGAEDYVAKPFSPRELILRVENVLRRRRAPDDDGRCSKFGAFELDREKFEIRADGTKLELTALEFKLLAMLLENAPLAVSREVLLRDVWGYRGTPDSRTVDTHVRRLRGKLGAYADRVETRRGEGYCFRVEGGD
ncbi:MAG: response regulator transcription factor [Chthoniobacterales bacterium]